MKKNDPRLSANGPPAALSKEDEFKREMEIAREVMTRRREALRQLALADKITDEDREILRSLAKD